MKQRTRSYTPQGLAGRRAALSRSIATRQRAADDWARTLAPTIQSIILQGNADIPGIRDALNRCQVPNRKKIPWTYANTERLIVNLRRLGLVATPEDGCGAVLLPGGRRGTADQSGSGSGEPDGRRVPLP